MSFAALALIAAAGWSPTQSFDAGAAQFHEPVPRVAIDARGRALLAYETGDRRLVVRARRDGRFTRPVTLAKRTHDYAVAPGAVVYQAKDGIHVATAPRFKPRKVASSTGNEINGLAIAADPLGGWVVAERQFPRRGSGPRKTYRIRTLSLDKTGAPLGPPQELGPGEFGIDARPTQALATLPDGRAILTFRRESPNGTDPAPVVYAIRPHGGAFSAPATVGDGLTDPRVTVAGEKAVLTATETAVCGDTQCAGQPRAFPLNPDGSLGAPQGPTLDRPSRAFGPWAVPSAIVFQLKTGPKPFSREAPVRAAALTPNAPLQTLTKRPATEPVALPLDHDRTLALWATKTRFGAALAGPSGRFHTIKAPQGPPPEVFHTNSTNRDVRSSGRYAIVAWSRGHTVRVSVRRF